MSALPVRPHHLHNLPPAIVANVSELFKMKLPDDLHQQTAFEILNGKPLNIAIRHARAQVNRDNRSCAFLSLDNSKEDAPSLYDMIACTNPSEFIDGLSAYRLKTFNSQSETVFWLMRNSASTIDKFITGKAVLTVRRKQQIVAENIEVQASAYQFKEGGKGQGQLFRWDGSIDGDGDGGVDHE